MLYEEKIVKRIPGNPVPNPRESQGFIDDLNNKSRIELVELLERQNKILSNKSFVSKLPDKGKRITDFRDKIQSFLTKKDTVEEACGLLSGLSLKSSKNVSEEIEWTGKISNGKEALDSDDDEEETDPIKILASQGVGTLKKTYKEEKPEESLIKPSDLEDIESFKRETKQDLNLENKQSNSRSSTPDSRSSTSSGIPDADLYVRRLCEKAEKPREKKFGNFKPYRTTISDVHSLSRVPKPKGRHWEVTAATPPDPIHGEVKVVSIEESLELQKIQAAKLKEIQTKHAAERLATQMSMKMGSLPDSSRAQKYREPADRFDSSSSSEDEFHSGGEEEEEVDRGRTAVFYNFTEDTPE